MPRTLEVAAAIAKLEERKRAGELPIDAGLGAGWDEETDRQIVCVYARKREDMDAFPASVDVVVPPDVASTTVKVRVNYYPLTRHEWPESRA
jgi:hypothetical protein